MDKEEVSWHFDEVTTQLSIHIQGHSRINRLPRLSYILFPLIYSHRLQGQRKERPRTGLNRFLYLMSTWNIATNFQRNWKKYKVLGMDILDVYSIRCTVLTQRSQICVGGADMLLYRAKTMWLITFRARQLVDDGCRWTHAKRVGFVGSSSSLKTERRSYVFSTTSSKLWRFVICIHWHWYIHAQTT